MNLNRVVNYLYISLDGQILENIIGWQQKTRVDVTFKVEWELTQGS